MRNAASELPQRFHFLRLAQGFFGIAAPAHIQLRCEKINQFALVVVHRRNEQCVPERQTISAPVKDFGGALAALFDHRANLVHHRPVGFRTL
jgi:hypothetical protein